MTRRLLALSVLVLTAVGVVAATPAAAEAPEPKTHVLCVGASNGPQDPFDGICVWVPLPV